MDGVDKLLAQLQAEQQQQQQRSPDVDPRKQPAPVSQSLDDLLGQLGEDTRRSVRAELSKQPAAFQPPPPAPFPRQAMDALLPSQPPPENSLLADLKSHYQEQDQAEALKRQQELQETERRRQQQERQRQRQEQEKQRRLEALRQQRRAELAGKARSWLKQLNPKSEEGRWFDEFACGYESRLEAAIDYLEALQSVGQKLE
jgi:hypothetical protein